jgi:hypothetical protein
MRVFLSPYVDTLPSKLLNSNKCLANVGIFGDHVRAQVKCKALRVKDVWRGLCDVCDGAQSREFIPLQYWWKSYGR